MKTYTHKTTGWTRTATGYGQYTIHPTDGTPDRVVVFLSAGTWQNTPGDDQANADRDRVILLSGPALPDWAVKWLETANAIASTRARQAFRAAVEDDEDAFFGRNTGW